MPRCSLFLCPDTVINPLPRHLYTSMFKAVRSALLDRTNRSSREGAAPAADIDRNTAETVACSESSGSEAANEPVFASASSDQSSHDPNDSSDSNSISDNDGAMHPGYGGHTTYRPGHAWRFTQYGRRQFHQKKQ